MIKDVIKKLAEGLDLNFEESKKVMDEILSGQATAAQTAAVITALRMKGETTDEISGFASVMRKHAVNLEPKTPYFVDTCGTGGDVSGTFNISTVSSFVAAGAGVTIAKHGNRAVSSKCGSADLLEALGVKVDVDPEIVRESIDTAGIGFIFAPSFHKAMKFAAPIRKEIGIRTIFNILGPVSNPANTKGQLMGVYAAGLTTVMAEVLKKQGCQTALVVHGMDGMDEITMCDKTKVSHLQEGIIKEYFIEPEDFGLSKHTLSDFLGGSTEENKKIALDILSGREKGPKRDIVLINSAAALMVGLKAHDFATGIKAAQDSIDNGQAMDKLESLIKMTNK